MRILAVTKYFPPETNSQSLQMGRVTGAIREAGCEVHVVAALFADRLGRALERAENGCTIHYIPAKRPEGSNRVTARAARRIVDEISTIHSTGRWVTEALAEALRISRFFRPEILFTASTPFDSHLVGLRMTGVQELPWVASFSDPWPAAVTPDPYRRRAIPFLSRFQRRFLRRVLREAHGIHMPSRIAIDTVQDASGVRIKDKSRVIPHIGLHSPPEEAFPPGGWLMHIGHLTRERVSRPLLEAVETLTRGKPSLFRGLLCVGWVCPEFHDLVRRLKMTESVRFMNPVTEYDAGVLARSASALVVIEADMPFSPFLPSKFADYACSRRPIIAITPPSGAVREYLARYGGGIAVLNQREEILEALSKVLLSNSETRISKQSPGEAGLASPFCATSVATRYLDLFLTAQEAFRSNPGRCGRESGGTPRKGAHTK
jgi:glycosyltransferase involved in cell wall biosynthesis